MKWIIGQVNTKDWRLPMGIGYQSKFQNNDGHTTHFTLSGFWIVSIHCTARVVTCPKRSGICRIQLRKQNTFGSNRLASIQCNACEYNEEDCSEVNWIIGQVNTKDWRLAMGIGYQSKFQNNDGYTTHFTLWVYYSKYLNNTNITCKKIIWIDFPSANLKFLPRFIVAFAVVVAGSR